MQIIAALTACADQSMESDPIDSPLILQTTLTVRFIIITASVFQPIENGLLLRKSSRIFPYLLNCGSWRYPLSFSLAVIAS